MRWIVGCMLKHAEACQNKVSTHGPLIDLLQAAYNY